jgi:hypothetical protein
MGSDPYYDPEGLYESNKTPYMLTVFEPTRPPAFWKPKIFTRQPVTHPDVGATAKLPPGNSNPNLDNFQPDDLPELPRKTITIKSKSFDLDMRCDHVENSHTCDKGCYVREKGGDWCREKCARKDCEGHVYMGRVKEHEGVKCFGEKGKRMVCLARPVFS